MYNFSFVHQALSLIGKTFSDLQQVILVLLSRFLFFFLPLSHFVVFAVLHFLCIFPGDFADFLIHFFFHQNFSILGVSLQILFPFTPMEDTAPLSLALF